MAKKFFYVCAGILMLAWALAASAVPVDPNAPDGIAARFVGGDVVYVLCTSGEVHWHSLAPNPSWRLLDPYPAESPVPLSEIADWGVRSLVTFSGNIWVAYQYSGNPPQWYLLEPVDCQGPVNSESESMGDVKSMFR